MSDFFFPRKITLFIHCRGLGGSSYQVRGMCYQLWISYLGSHFALATPASGVHFLCKDRLQQHKFSQNQCKPLPETVHAGGFALQ